MAVAPIPKGPKSWDRVSCRSAGHEQIVLQHVASPLEPQCLDRAIVASELRHRLHQQPCHPIAIGDGPGTLSFVGKVQRLAFGTKRPTGKFS